MDKSLVSAYRALNEAQGAIARADSLDDALRDGLKAMLQNCGAEYGVIWYADFATITGCIRTFGSVPPT